MPTERIQRRIDQLLDEADQAMVQREWDDVRSRCQAVLGFQPDNADAREYLAAVERIVSSTAQAEEAGPPAPPAPMALPTSFVNGRFHVLGLLGEGGRKVVYRVHDAQLDRDVAFALIKTEGLDAEARERVQREARTLGRLSAHPNIVTIHEIGDEPGGPWTEDQGRASQTSQAQPFLVTELMDGGDLVQVLQDAPDHRLPLQRVLSIGSGVAGALAFAHGKGVVHRDVKPGNVWLTAEGTAKLGDFGLATAASDPRLTQAGMMVGTALYLAPEQAMGQDVTPRSDLYSLGCVLYELVTGRPPFVGDENVAIIGQHLNANPVAPAWHRPDCPKALEALVLQLLEKDPAKRPAAAADVVQALVVISVAPALTPSQPAPAERASSGSANPVYRRIFVGRETELRQLEAAFDAAVSGQGGLVMVVGEPGIGKTTLTEQLGTYAALRGGKTLVGHCYEEGSLSLPYLPFVEAMRSYVLERDPGHLRTELGSTAPEVARIVSEVRDRVQVSPSPPSADPGEDRYRLLNAISSFLRNAASVQPLVIVLEDLHDADRGTLELLLHLSRQLLGARLLVVGTYRDIEVDRAHPLSPTLAELRRSASFSRMVLRGLTADEVRRMLSAITGQEVQWGLAEAVFKQTEGNPLFVQEVIRYLAEEGFIARDGGRWRPAAGASLLEAIPEGLRDVIGKRLSRLSNECNRLLAVAAVIGRDFLLATLLAVTGEPEGRCSELLDEALKIAVLQAQAQVGRVQYRFAHAFFRQALYEELSPPRRLRLHQQVARALEAQYASRLEEHAGELAEHFAQSTDAVDLAKAVQYGEVAAQRAMSVYAYGEAVRLLRQAVDVQEVLDPDASDRLCSLLLDLAEAMRFAGDLQAIVDDIAPRALRLAEGLGDRSRAGRACLFALQAHARFSATVQATSPERWLWVDRLDQLAQPGTVERVHADAARAVSLHFSGRHGDAWDSGTRALALARTLDDRAALSYAVNAVVFLDGRPSNRRQREVIADEFQYLTENPTDEGTQLLYSALLGLFLSQGRRDDAEEQVRRLERYVERSGDERRGMSTVAGRALLATVDGRFEDALALGETILQLGDEVGSPVSAQLQAATVRTRALVQLGRAEQALSEGPQARRPAAGAEQTPAESTLQMWLLAQAGHRAEALAYLHRFVALLQADSQQSGENELTRALMTAVALGDATIGTLLAEQLAGGDVDYGETIDRLAFTCVARHLGALAAMQGDRNEAKRRYAQALTVAARCRTRPETVQTRLQLAELLSSGDESEQQDAREHLVFVIPEFEAMGMQPALDRALKLRDRLSGPLSVLSPKGESDTGAPGTGTSVSEENSTSARSGQPDPPDTSTPSPLSTGPESGATGSPFPGEAAREGDGDRASDVRPARQVFISYASEDRERAVALAVVLEAEGRGVWLDQRSITGGTSWDAEIVRGIRGCALVAVLVSRQAMQSANVQQELRLALEERKPLLPLLLERIEYPDEVRYALAGRQHVELLDHPEATWLPRVLAAIKRLA